VPEYESTGAITLRDLLAMRSGLPNFTDNPRFTAAQHRSPRRTWTPARTLIYAGPPTSAPGEEREYSNTNYTLLGLAIERATGMSLARARRADLLDRRAFARIAMQPDERPRGSVAVGYQVPDDGGEPEPTPNNGYVPSRTEATTAWPAGAMLASARDLARAGHGVFAGDLISAEARRQMTRFTPTDHETPREYGLGLALGDLGGQEVWGHSGDITGFHADLVHLPKHGVTIAAVHNLQHGQQGQEALVEELIFDVAEHAQP
jgi:D-alanyl-D-alanine carboxypeptidase